MRFQPFGQPEVAIIDAVNAPGWLLSMMTR
jgi:hypothetical protein